MKHFIKFSYLFLILFLVIANNIYSQIQRQSIDQIQKLLSEKLSRNPAQRKISSQLLQAVRESQGRPMTEGVKLAPSQLGVGLTGKLQIDINARVTEDLLQRIRSLGGRIIYSYPNFHSLRVEIKTSSVEAIGAYPEVRSIRPADKGFTVGSIHKRESGVGKEFENSKKVENYLHDLMIGSVNTEGDVTHGANDARRVYGYQGQGVKIGVLSGSFNYSGNEEKDIESGDLPGANNPFGNTTPVTVLEDAAGTDEGRGMLEIVHDIAPKARLFFATANNGQADYANNILILRNTYHCDIILDDEFYIYEPVYQDGIIAQAVNSVTANGALYFASAGNSGSVAKNDPGVWEGDFNDAGSPVFNGSAKLGTVHNFGTLAMPEGGDTVLAGSEYKYYTLNWSDPLGASNNDYDFFMLDQQGNVQYASTDIQDGTEDPQEVIYPYFGTNFKGYQLVVFKAANAQIRAFSLNTFGGRLKHGTIGEAHGHSNCASAISIAATNAATAFPNRFSSSDQVENFSSEGPRRMFFNSDTSAITPGNYLFATNGGTVLNKPDLTAADNVSTNWLTPFPGTSAASPHAGAIAALLLSANPSLTAGQIKSIMMGTALDIEAPGYDINSGFGIIQAFQAMQSVNPVPLTTLSLGTVTENEASHSNHNGTVDPGETGSLVVQLNINQTNSTNAIPVHAVLSTSTPGVSILQANADYNIVPGSSDENTNSPFVIALDPTIKCGAVINFTIVTNLSDGFSGIQRLEFTETVGPGVCPPICTSPLTLISGAYLPTPVPGIRYSQIFAATGGSNSGNYSYSLNGNLPGGIYFNGDSLYGMVTEGGDFAFYITVNDPRGCSIIFYYDFSISGIIATSIKTAGGESQSAMIGNTFANPFKVKVFNGKKILPGVNVTFTAPTNPVQGTFADGSTLVRVVTDNTGIATAPPFMAVNSPGTYIVTASANNITPVEFSLKNNCIPTMVTTNADSGPGSLRYIVANSCPGSKITFASGISQINLTGGEIEISKSLIIKGPGANLLTISGSNLSRIFNINLNWSDSLLVTGITISNGLAPSNSRNGGGGILVNAGQVNIQDCLIANNDASPSEFSSGGGIDIENGWVNITGCSIIQNSAGYYGGGISFLNQGSLTIINSTIANNTIHTTDGIGNGGGICSLSPYGGLSLFNCTIYGNSANNGGNIYAGGNYFTIGSTVIAGGTVNSSGVAPDLWGNIYSAGFNLVQNITGGNPLNGYGDIVSVNPNLFPLGNYGGDLPTLLPQPNSPVIDAGYSFFSSFSKDERGNKRVANGMTDIGAVETNYKSAAFAGTPQSAMVNTTFSTALQGIVTESGNPVAGVNMVFMAPVKGPGGLFIGGYSSVSAITDLSGIAIAPDFTANGTIGNYVVFDSVGNSIAKTKFNLSNIKSTLPTLSSAQIEKDGMVNRTLLAYPNPARNILTVLLPTSNRQMVNIFDANGRLVHSSPVSTDRLNLNISNWASGVYIISVTDGNNIYTVRFVKE